VDRSYHSPKPEARASSLRERLPADRNGALQSDLVARIVIAAWRARRADRLEAAVLGRHLDAGEFADHLDRQAALGCGLMRDGNGPRALETLLRYRGSVLAELFRSLAALKLPQADACVATDDSATLPSRVVAPQTVTNTKPTQKVPVDQ
jgi:hypothetical protein